MSIKHLTKIRIYSLNGRPVSIIGQSGKNMVEVYTVFLDLVAYTDKDLNLIFDKERVILEETGAPASYLTEILKYIEPSGIPTSDVYKSNDRIVFHAHKINIRNLKTYALQNNF